MYVDPVTKKHFDLGDAPITSGLPDFRVFLRNTHGYSTWEAGQSHFEKLEQESLVNLSINFYRDEYERDADIYKNFNLEGLILDVGCGSGTLRAHLPSQGAHYFGCDVYDCTNIKHSQERKKVYPCLDDKFSFLLASAEFLPFDEATFDIVHMRSMLDHVQIPDLALLEAKRVCKKNGFIIIGLLLEPTPSDKGYLTFKLKDTIKSTLSYFYPPLADYHMFHPTLPSLEKLLEDAGLAVEASYFQKVWSSHCVYVKAIKK